MSSKKPEVHFHLISEKELTTRQQWRRESYCQAFVVFLNNKGQLRDLKYGKWVLLPRHHNSPQVFGLEEDWKKRLKHIVPESSR